MRNNLYGLLVSTLGASLLLVGCSQEPTTDVQNAKTALDAAKVAEAQLYAADQYTKAQAAYDSAMVSIAQQQSKNTLLRNYDNASAHLAEAIKAGNEAKTTAIANRKKVASEVGELLPKLKTEMENVKGKIDAAAKAKKDVKAFNASLDSASILLASATNASNASDFTNAKILAETILNMVAVINNSVDSISISESTKQKK